MCSNCKIILLCIAFNWKQKVELGIKGGKRKDFKARPSGVDLTEITNFLNAARGDMEIDLSDMKEFKEEPRPSIDKYKVVDVSRLYGSSKPCGALVVEHIPYTGPFTKRRMSKGRML